MRSALSRSTVFSVSGGRPSPDSSVRQRSGVRKGKSLPHRNCPDSRPRISRITSAGMRRGDQPEMSM